MKYILPVARDAIYCLVARWARIVLWLLTKKDRFHTPTHRYIYIPINRHHLNERQQTFQTLFPDSIVRRNRSSFMDFGIILFVFGVFGVCIPSLVNVEIVNHYV